MNTSWKLWTAIIYVLAKVEQRAASVELLNANVGVPAPLTGNDNVHPNF